MTRDDLATALANVNVAAFLRVIRQGESNQDTSAYTIEFGGGHFNAPPWEHPHTTAVLKHLASTAAGAYQFLARTWDNLVKQYGFADFSPENQDLAAVALIAERGALPFLIRGDLHEVLLRCAKTWASLPGSPYGQPTQSWAQAQAVFEAYGGRVVVPDKAIPLQSAAPKSLVVSDTGKVTMGPFVIPILSALSSLIPQLGQLFGGTEVANRNIAAGSIIAQKLTEITQSANLQEAAEKIQSDPQALQAAKQVVADVVYQLSEAGGGGIDGARKFALSHDQPFWKQGAFWICLILIVMPFMLLADVFYVHPDSYSDPLRTQIVTAVLLVISMVGAFWTGSSFGSQKKDAVIAGQQ